PQFLGGDALGIFSYTRIALWGRVQSLVESVVTNFSDIHIWEAVLDLVGALNPPPAPETLPQERPIPIPRASTPPKSNSSVAEDTESVAAKKLRLFGELRNSLFRSVEGFWEKFFGAGRWETDSPDRHQMCKNLLKEYRNGNWEDRVWLWNGAGSRSAGSM
ncbi:hypothetical protein E4U45_006475, partial [Claviceps purpurea]